MDVHLLGPVEVLAGGRPLRLGTTKQRALLVLLALEAEQTVSSDRLIAGLWGEEPPASAQKMIQQYVSQLRKILEDDEAEILTRGRGYELSLGGGSTDVARFEALLDQDPRAALRLWRGAPLAEVADEPFAGTEIRRLEELRVHAHELAIDADLAAGRHREALREVEHLLADHRLRERLHAQRMLALYRSGRQAEALEAFREARAALVGEVGIEPGAELRALHERILRQDSSLDLPASPAAAPGPRPVPPPERRRVSWRATAVALAAVIAIVLIVLVRGDAAQPIGADRVGRLDGDGDVGARYAVGRGPGAVVAGGGAVWIASERDRTVTRIGIEDERTATIDVGAEPVGLAFGGGSLWVADGSAGRVVRVDPGTNRVLQEIELPNVPRAISAGHGSIWVASPVAGVLTRIDLGAGRVLPPLRVGGTPTALAASEDSLWVASESEGTVTELDPGSGTATRTVAVGGAPVALAVGAGAVWAVNRSDDTVSRVDLAGGNVSGTVRVGRAPVAVAAAADVVWVANSQDGTLSRIDPDDLRVTRTADVGGGPAGVVLHGDDLWAAAGGDVADHRGGTLRFGSIDSSNEWVLDPHSPESYDLTSQALLPLLYDGLVGYRRVGGVAGAQIVANLAETVPQPADEGRTYAFRLRPGLRYADGRPVRASDFRASLEHGLRVNEGGREAYRGLRGAATCTADGCDLSAGVDSDDEARTVVIRLRRPDPELLHKLSLPFAALLPADDLEVTGDPRPGTGPYRWEARDPDGDTRLVRNPRSRSWSQDTRPPAFVDSIVVSADTADADVRVGYVPQDPDELRALATRHGGRLRADPTPMTQWVVLNTERPPFDDARARQAFNYAVDRERVAQLSGGPEAGEITCRFLPLGLAGHRPLCPFTVDAGNAGGWRGPDLERARRLIRASGTRGQRVELWSLDQFGEVGPYLRDLLRNLGYRPRLRVFNDVEAYFGGLTSGEPHAALNIWFGDALTSSNFIVPNFTCGHQLNFSGLCDRRLDLLVERAYQAREAAAADVLWDRVERRLTTLAPAVPLLHGRRLTILGGRTGNFQNHPLWGPLLDQMWVR